VTQGTRHCDEPETPLVTRRGRSRTIIPEGAARCRSASSNMARPGSWPRRARRSAHGRRVTLRHVRPARFASRPERRHPDRHGRRQLRERLVSRRGDRDSRDSVSRSDVKHKIAGWLLGPLKPPNHSPRRFRQSPAPPPQRAISRCIRPSADCWMLYITNANHYHSCLHSQRASQTHELAYRLRSAGIALGISAREPR